MQFSETKSSKDLLWLEITCKDSSHSSPQILPALLEHFVRVPPSNDLPGVPVWVPVLHGVLQVGDLWLWGGVRCTTQLRLRSICPHLLHQHGAAQERRCE